MPACAKPSRTTSPQERRAVGDDIEALAEHAPFKKDC
jgi:hypothetical protein